MGLFSCRKKKDNISKASTETEPEEKKEKIKKVSIFQLFRYGTSFDYFLLLFGGCVAIATGMGMPFLSIIMGKMSQSFINMTSLMNNQTSDYDPDKFNHDVISKSFWSAYMGIGLFVFSSIQVTCFLIASENMMHKMRKEFFQAILRQEISWFDLSGSGTLTTKLFDNLERVKEGTGDKVALAIQYTAQFFGGFLIAFWYDWKLTLIMMSLSPLMVLTGIFLAKIMARTTSVEARNYGIAGKIAEEALTSLRTVFAFNGQSFESDRYEKALIAGKRSGIIKGFTIGTGFAATYFVMFGSYCLAFWIGTNFVVDKTIKPETLITVFFSVMMGSTALGQAGPQHAVIATAQGAASDVFDIIDRNSKNDDDEGIKVSSIEGRISFSNVNFNYPSRSDIPILSDISFDILPGESVALVGASGCGKSTIVAMLLRFYDIQSGEIKIDGHEISNLNVENLRSFIGIVSQEPAFSIAPLKKI